MLKRKILTQLSTCLEKYDISKLCQGNAKLNLSFKVNFDEIITDENISFKDRIVSNRPKNNVNSKFSKKIFKMNKNKNGKIDNLKKNHSISMINHNDDDEDLDKSYNQDFQQNY